MFSIVHYGEVKEKRKLELSYCEKTATNWGKDVTKKSKEATLIWMGWVNGSVPRLRNEDFGGVFRNFEKIARMAEWSKDKWPMLLQTRYSGRSLRVLTAMSYEEYQSYDLVKRKILDCNEQVPELYWQKFRQAGKSSPVS